MGLYVREPQTTAAHEVDAEHDEAAVRLRDEGERWDGLGYSSRCFPHDFACSDVVDAEAYRHGPQLQHVGHVIVHIDEDLLPFAGGRKDVD